MGKLEFVRPGRGVKIDANPTKPDFMERRAELAADVRNAMNGGRLIIANLATVETIAPKELGDDDTAWPKGPVKLRHNQNNTEVELDRSFWRILEDGTAVPGEPIVIPLHATSIIFSAIHDRSYSWYSTGIITCEDQALQAGEAERPFFVWIDS